MALLALNSPEAVEFRDRLERMLDESAETGLNLHVVVYERSPWEQARLWRQSRSTFKVNQQKSILRAAGAPWIAQVLEDVGPQREGPWRTNALPGQSWHQWGEAADVYVIDNTTVLGQKFNIVWRGDDPRYAAMHARAIAAGLHVPLAEKDAGHIQLRRDGAPRFAWSKVNEAMERIWSPFREQELD